LARRWRQALALGWSAGTQTPTDYRKVAITTTTIGGVCLSEGLR